MQQHPAYAIEKEVEIENIYSFFINKICLGYTFAGESHNFYECLYLMDGEIEIASGNSIYIMNKGNIIFHTPMAHHKFSIKSESATIMVISFSIKNNDRVNNLSGMYTLNESQNNIIKGLEEIYLDGISNGARIDDEDIYNEFSRTIAKDRGKLYSVSLYLTLLICSLKNSIREQDETNEEGARIFRLVVNIMHQMVTENPTVNDFASQVNVSPSTLKRIFKRYTGVGIHNYFMSVKIKTATNLLKNGKNVGEVSDMLSFPSTSYFSTVFKKQTGILPSKIKHQS